MRLVAAVAVAFCLLVSACRESPSPQTSPERTGDATGSLDFRNVETIVGGLDVPWEIGFVDEDTALITERSGRVRLIDAGRVREEPVAELSVRSSGEAGLLGLALHPEFPEERYAYVYYTEEDQNVVSRFRLDEAFRSQDVEVLIDGIPAADVHDGGRIAFGPDGKLYVGTGDAGNGRQAADRRSLAGKILRVEPDGSVPDDNPFEDSPVYSYGHRNVQGLDWDDEGRLYVSEHGPTGEFGQCCHDEINRIEVGGFYGWPFFAGRTRTSEQGEPPGRALEPIAESREETWAPAGLAVHQDGRTTRLLVATLRGERLMSFDAQDPSAANVALDGQGRLRGARFGPDGCLYLTTSNTDGRGSPRDDDDRVLRICSRE